MEAKRLELMRMSPLTCFERLFAMLEFATMVEANVRVSAAVLLKELTMPRVLLNCFDVAFVRREATPRDEVNGRAYVAALEKDDPMKI